MRSSVIALTKAFLLLSVAGTSAFAQAGGTCSIPAQAADGLSKGFTYERSAETIGCAGRKLSSFAMLGRTTEVFEFQDGRQRVQVTFQDGKLISFTNRPLDAVATGSLKR